MGGSFNTRGFFHGKSAGAPRSLKWVFLRRAIALLLLAVGLAALLVLAFVVQRLLAQRRVFLDLAKHPLNLCHQAVP